MNETYIYKYLTGTCTLEELRQLNEWIAASEENARFFFQTEELYHRGKINLDDEAESMHAAAKKLFERIEKQEHRKRKIYQFRWLSYAAVLLALFTIGGTIWYQVGQTSRQELQQVFADADGKIKQVTLPDGTNVWLNHDSQLSYSKDFTEGNERVVHLKGEAYFEVAKYNEIPFVVKDDFMHVRVLGTTFNMKSDEKNRMSTASLIEGTIEVKGNNNEGSVTLTPGQEARIDSKTKRLTVKQVNTRMSSMWRKQMIPLDQENIEEIARKLEQYYPITIELDPDIDRESTYSGVLKQTEAIDSVLKSLKNSVPIEYTITDKNIYITNKQ